MGPTCAPILASGRMISALAMVRMKTRRMAGWRSDCKLRNQPSNWRCQQILSFRNCGLACEIGEKLRGWDGRKMALASEEWLGLRNTRKTREGSLTALTRSVRRFTGLRLQASVCSACSVGGHRRPSGVREGRAGRRGASEGDWRNGDEGS